MIKKILIGAAAALAVLFAIVLFIGPSDPVVLTDEEYEQQKADETSAFADLDLSSFKTVTLDGKSVTSKDCFGDYAVTMVNIWVTGCGPCVNEMPEIQALYADRPENTNVITICLDATLNSKDTQFAARVMKDAQAEFDTLIPDTKINEELRSRVTVFPTTVFVDSNGKIIGAPYFGAHDKPSYEKALQEKLEEVTA